MNLQPMVFGMNQLSTAQLAKPPQGSTSNKDEFSFVLEQSNRKNDWQQPATKSRSHANKPPVYKVDKKVVTSEPKTEKTKAKDKRPKDEEDTRVTKEISDLLQITPQELEQTLAILQIKISDLLEGDHLQKLMMEVNGLEEPMDLLAIPEISSQIKMIASVVEEHIAQVALIPTEELLVATSQDSQLGAGEVQPKVKGLGVGLSNQKENQENANLENTNEILEVEAEELTMMNVENPTNKDLSKGKDQPSQGQTSLTNEFLDNLSQSMGDVFQSQNTQIGKVGEVAAARHEVVNPRMILDQIIEKIKVSTMDEEAKMNILLKPAHLGKLSMEIVSKQGVMTAQFKVESEKAKEIIEQNMESLRESLESKGLVIEQLEVTVGQNQNDDREAYKGPKHTKNISDIIEGIMNEEAEEELLSDPVLKNNTGEVDFIA